MEFIYFYENGRQYLPNAIIFIFTVIFFLLIYLNKENTLKFNIDVPGKIISNL